MCASHNIVWKENVYSDGKKFQKYETKQNIYVTVINLILPEQLSSPPFHTMLCDAHIRSRKNYYYFSGVRATRSLVLFLCFVDRCLSFVLFSLCQCVICSSSIYGFWTLYEKKMYTVMVKNSKNMKQNKTYMWPLLT
jgi:hypothetical protein